MWNWALVNLGWATGLKVNPLATLLEAFKANTRRDVLMGICNGRCATPIELFWGKVEEFVQIRRDVERKFRKFR